MDNGKQADNFDSKEAVEKLLECAEREEADVVILPPEQGDTYATDLKEDDEDICHRGNSLPNRRRCCRRRRHRLKGIHFSSDTNWTEVEGLFFYYPRLLHCLDQMLAVMSLSQHRVSSSKTVRPRAPCGTRCIGHAVRTWYAVCSEAPHSQFGERARPHLCMDE